MSNIVQYSIILNSQNRLRTADRLAREWAIAHAGAYQGQARRELGGSERIREWQNDDLSIRIAKLSTGEFKQVQLVSVSYEPAGSAEPYVGYVMTYTSSDAEQSGGHLFSVVSAPETWTNEQVPWDDKAGFAGLEKAVDSVAGERGHSRNITAGDREVTAIDDLFAIHDAAVVLTADGQRETEFEELADTHGDWAAVVAINPLEQLVISRELPDHQLAAWVRTKIALFFRHADQDGNRLRMAETDSAQARSSLDEERERFINGAAGRNAVALRTVLESVARMQSDSTLTDVEEAGEGVAEPPEPPPTESQEDPTADVPAQQRVYLLQDQLGDAQKTIAELQERLAQYENYDAESRPDESEPAKPETIIDNNREITVLEAIINPDRFPRLRFLTNCEKPLAAYGKPRPNGVEIVAALDAINRLALSWYNTPSRSIGSWDNYFTNLPGWKHADSESDFTMSRFGEKRSFSDQEHGRHVTITRHLTYQGSSSGFQIYFDRDDVTDNFIIGYIGEHLPYATDRS